METETTVLDPERQKRAKAYARIQRRLFIISLVIGAVYAAVWLVLGWAGQLRDALLQWTAHQWLLVAGFVILFGVIYFLIDLPLTYYSDYVLPHHYELSTQDFKGWVLDQIKSLALTGVLGLILVEVIYILLRTAPDTWWLWVAAILLFVNVILANLAPVVIMPLFNKYTPLGDEYADLAERLLRLAERANTRVQGVFKFDMSRRTKAANAGLTGLGNTRRIVLGDTLLSEFTPDEIETVLAHELGHHVHKDIPILIAVDSIITLVGLYLASLGLSQGTVLLGLEGVADIAAFPLLLLVLGAYSIVTMPLGNAFSRWRERMADGYALALTHNGEAYASALTRLANQNLADADPDPLIEFFMHSHPALRKRIAMAQDYQERS
jgi:STE24 endopeptidase